MRGKFILIGSNRFIVKHNQNITRINKALILAWMMITTMNEAAEKMFVELDTILSILYRMVA
jgi:hypothetical protein